MNQIMKISSTPYVRVLFINKQKGLNNIYTQEYKLFMLFLNLFINATRTYIRSTSNLLNSDENNYKNIILQNIGDNFTTNVTTTIPVDIYKKARDKGVQLSQALKKGILSLVEEKEVVDKCDYCGSPLEIGNIRYIALKLEDYNPRIAGYKNRRRCIAVCKEEHKHIRDWEMFSRCQTNEP